MSFENVTGGTAFCPAAQTDRMEMLTSAIPITWPFMRRLLAGIERPSTATKNERMLIYPLYIHEIQWIFDRWERCCRSDASGGRQPFSNDDRRAKRSARRAGTVPATVRLLSY